MQLTSNRPSLFRFVRKYSRFIDVVHEVLDACGVTELDEGLFGSVKATVDGWLNQNACRRSLVAAFSAFSTLSSEPAAQAHFAGGAF